MRKKVDQRIQTLIDNCIRLNQRGFFVIVGDRGRDQVVNLHYLLTKSQLKTKPKVLWCYKNELGFSSHKKKRMKQINALQKKGVYDNDVEDPFELFVSSSDIRYCYYKETQKVLGQTYQLLILQDFEALTPNILCRTMETISGGGFVILLLNTMGSLKKLHELSMDVHNRYKTDQFSEVIPRFNKRFMLSLGNCPNTVVMDDELNILPISSLINDIKPLSKNDTTNKQIEEELEELKESLNQNNLVGPLVNLAKTLDQAKCIMQFVDSITHKQLRYTIAMTAGRGRGKSAGMGISLAAAIAQGFSNIFVTSPTPENLNTFFQFVVLGLQALGYKENMHYDIIQSTNPDFNNAVIRINIFKSHRQVIQYVMPTDHQQVGSADLVVIDEAASIPADNIKKMIGPYLVFMASTVNGYEGTGRSLSLKLIQQLKQSSRNTSNQQVQQAHGGRILKELSLNDPIRYALNDPLEKWLNNLLLLDAIEAVPLKQGMPHPNDCELYYVNRDTLFSYKKPTEKFLFNLMSLFISSHYKNSPNDLQMLSDAPAHGIFVLLNSITVNSGQQKDLPDILCAVQVSMEGKLTSSTLNKQYENQGYKPSGDLIPWILSEQFQDKEFPKLNGARIVRVATHPAALKMGYGSKTIELLQTFFEGKLVNLSNNDEDMEEYGALNNSSPGEKPQMKPILKKLTEIKPPQIDYVGVSYGLSKLLYNFWKKSQFTPLYLRQTKNEVTSEHTCIMLKSLRKDDTIEDEEDVNNETSWEKLFQQDFNKRFLSLLGYQFRDLDLNLALGIINYKQLSQDEIQNKKDKFDQNDHDDQVHINGAIVNKETLELFISLYDLKRLEAYSKSLVDFHNIIDLLPIISKLYFENKLPTIHLSYGQAAILLGLGLQHKDIEKIALELNYPVNQCLALFIKAMKKMHTYFKGLHQAKIEKEMNKNIKKKELMPVKNTLGEELQDEGDKFVKELQERNLQGDTQSLNKKRKGKYNFEIADIDEKDINMGKNGNVQAKRAKSDAFNNQNNNKNTTNNNQEGPKNNKKKNFNNKNNNNNNNFNKKKVKK